MVPQFTPFVKKKKWARPVPPHLLWAFPPVSNGNDLIALEYLVLCLFTHCHNYKSHGSRVPGRHFTCPLPFKASQTLTHFPHFCWTELGSWGINEATAPQPLPLLAGRPGATPGLSGTPSGLRIFRTRPPAWSSTEELTSQPQGFGPVALFQLGWGLPPSSLSAPRGIPVSARWEW